MGKSVKKLVKKAGPVIGATVGFVACGGNPVCASVGAGIGGVAGGAVAEVGEGIIEEGNARGWTVSFFEFRQAVQAGFR